ncbi:MULTISPECIES: MIP/aquaporin family protein [Glutamicibacter]|uniref:MIP/aquaporin family protein n=2 Tax=Glutamicibacter TaxID=1742989 RepID=A0ABV9MI30_9MICC|nr:MULTISPECIES: MIP/aquaporin family protein [Glutamicibacter]GGJ65177.1 glycerol transporter [Glutamicibacter ardleyensis]
MLSTHVFLAELAGTFILILMGSGVCANVALKGTLGSAAGWLAISFGWGLGVYCGVWIAGISGAHLNPAVTLGLLINPDAAEYAPGVAKTFANTMLYFLAQLVGAFLGAVGTWLAYKKHLDDKQNAGNQLGVFATGPAIRSYGWNVVSEIFGTFVLVFVIAGFGKTPHELGPLAVALLVVAIGLSLGGATGYAINPTRDLGPRLAHAILPIKGKGSSDWAYAWVPIVGPVIGGLLGGVGAGLLF